MDDIVLSPIPINQLLEKFREIVREEISIQQVLPGAKENPITRKELIERLGISEPSVIRWEKKGLIPSIRIGTSIRYNWGSVLQALESRKKKK